MVPGNIWCSPAHIGQVAVTAPYLDNANLTQVNRVCKFLKNMYYGWLGDNIWEFDAQVENAQIALVPPTGAASGNPGGVSNWIVAATPSTFGGEHAIGMYPMMIENVPYVTTCVQQSATTWRSVKLNGNTSTWTSGVMSGTTSAVVDANGGIHAELRHKNLVYFITTSSVNEIKVYSPQFDTISPISLPSTLRFPMDLCVFENRIYLLAKEDIGGGRADIVVYEILGSFVQKVLTLEANAATGTRNYEGRNSLFVDNYYSNPAKFYAINYMEGTPDGAGLWEMELQNGVLVKNGRLPSNPNMPRGVGIGGGDENDIWRVFNDSKRVPGSGGIPLWEFRADGDRSSEYQAYIFQGSGAGQPFWVNIANHWIFSYAHERGPDIGARIGNAGEVTLDINSYDFSRGTQGLIGINYEIIPSFTSYPAGTPIAIRFFYEEKGHAPKKIATIKTASSGTISGNRILLTAISGVELSVDWDFAADKITTQRDVNLIYHVSTTGVV
ncbi:hypothetical protein E4G67_00540 [Candidatus Bathyarchaeota archaeon]|nr:MAG: hypothetical protein E4G67_00540 [Candidatus Bathyarchaeota archaeon]